MDTFKDIWILIRECKRWKSFEVGKEELANSARTHKGLFLLKSPTQSLQSHHFPNTLHNYFVVSYSVDLAQGQVPRTLVCRPSVGVASWRKLLKVLLEKGEEALLFEFGYVQAQLKPCQL